MVKTGLPFNRSPIDFGWDRLENDWLGIVRPEYVELSRAMIII